MPNAANAILMSPSIKYRLSENADIENIKNLLSDSGLPVADIEEGKIMFIVGVDESNDLIACGGIEQYGHDALLRSMAVRPVYRQKGIGRELLTRLFSISRQYGIRNLHLLTNTAEKFFNRAGFSVSSRESAPASIGSTAEFSFLCPSSSVYMIMKDIQQQESCFHRDAQVFQTDSKSGAAYWSINGSNLQLTYFDVQPRSVFEEHQHESEQVTHVLEGELFFEIENKTYCLRPGDSIIIPPGKLHKVWAEQHGAKAIDAWSPVNETYNHTKK